MTLHDRIADIWNTVQPDSVDDEGCPVWTNEGLAAAVLADPEIKAALELAERTVNVQTIAQEAAAAEREACAQIVDGFLCEHPKCYCDGVPQAIKKAIRGRNP